jgi:2-isopropylmalate synthase
MSTTSEANATLQLARWSVSSGSNVQSRGVVVIASGVHQWEGTSGGNGPVDALFRAVDRALHGVLTGHPRLLSYDVHAVAEGPDAEGLVVVEVSPPSSAAGPRASGRYRGESRSSNIIAASIAAYIEAINALLREEHWAGATEQAGNARRARTTAATRSKRAEIDKDETTPDTTAWFER